MKIHILQCGEISVAPGVISRGRGGNMGVASQLLASGARRVTRPVFAYLIEHPRGLILVDTGWAREVSPQGVYDASAARAALSAPLAAFYRPTLPLGASAYEQLSARGIRPEDIALIILTHLDPDHVSGLRPLAAARRIILPEDEYFWSCRTVYKLRQPPRLWMDLPIERVYYRGFPGVPNNWAADVFGDGTLYLVNLPGHTDGMAAVVAVSGGRFALFCADAAFSRRAVDELDVPGFGFDEGLQLKSLEWVRDMSRRPGCAGVFASHDAQVKPGLIEI